MYLSAFLENEDYTVLHDLTNQLYGLKQFIFHPLIGMQFITSDNPGYTKNAGKIMKTGGFGGDFIFYFPISPIACLCIDSSHKENLYQVEKATYHFVIEKKHVNEINLATKEISNKMLFSNSKSIIQEI